MWMCESAISCFLLNQVSDVFHLKHQKCENVISHIKILTVKPSCSCFMHLRVTEMSEDICLWWLAVWDQIKKCCPQLFSVSYWSSAASKNLKAPNMSVCLKNTERWSPFSVFGHDREIKTSTAIGVPQSQKNSVLMWIQGRFWLNEGSHLNQYHLDLKCDSYYSEW